MGTTLTFRTVTFRRWPPELYWPAARGQAPSATWPQRRQRHRAPAPGPGAGLAWPLCVDRHLQMARPSAWSWARSWSSRCQRRPPPNRVEGVAVAPGGILAETPIPGPVRAGVRGAPTWLGAKASSTQLGETRVAPASGSASRDAMLAWKVTGRTRAA